MEKWNELCLPDISDTHIRSILELQYTNYQYNKWMESLLKSFQISNEQFNVLKILQAEYPNAFSLKEIQKRLPNQTKNTTRLVDKLHKKDLVISNVNPNNKRQLQIIISKKGLNVLKEIETPFGAFIAKLKSTLTTEESKQLSHLLSKVYKMED
ncbi:MarR family winged helix-turn-helix transcriptional regulator [Pseudotenacibaculum haliotis]|uniref:MarR family winged helix-turn-helix transcriptional regulator n=1 Tax=Pseudotenacibaculum haliotis TaxID=1862138 RepID=A0ABW5LUA7_9FLAO